MPPVQAIAAFGAQREEHAGGLVTRAQRLAHAARVKGVVYFGGGQAQKQLGFHLVYEKVVHIVQRGGQAALRHRAGVEHHPHAQLFGQLDGAQHQRHAHFKAGDEIPCAPAAQHGGLHLFPGELFAGALARDEDIIAVFGNDANALAGGHVRAYKHFAGVHPGGLHPAKVSLSGLVVPNFANDGA